jgi:hypothetical protein
MAHDLLIVADATASMGTYLASLNDSLPEVIRISALTGCFDRIGIVAYRDYNGGKIVEWSGWYNVATGSAANIIASPKLPTSKSSSLNRTVKKLTLANTADQDLMTTREQLLAFARGLRAEFGGDWPEATKTGLAKAYEVMRTEVETIILLYADAPPHMPCTGGSNRDKERAALSKKASFGGYAPQFLDWVTACRTLAGRASDKGKDTTSMAKKARVFSIIQSSLADTLAPYVLLAHETGGATLQIANATSDSISQISLAVLLAWMGVEKQTGNAQDGKSESHTGGAKIATVERYKEVSWLDSLASETDNKAAAYLVEKDIPHMVNKVKDNLGSTDVSLDTLKNHIKPSDTSQILNFSKRYISDPAYRSVVVVNLTDIIESDVTAMAVNPVFGSLWRTVCNDRSSEYRDKLIEIFGRAIERIPSPEKKAQMKAWLEESYDYAGEIESLVASVGIDERFPCVYLDPTANFKPVTDEDGDDDEEVAKTKFSRDELLEIGRSCDYRILRRLGLVLTRLSYAATEADMPEHIRSADPPIATIPMALTSKKYQRKFWKVLLHLVLPGTMLSARPAALLAALSLRIGLAPLQDVADAELLSYKSWNNLEIPETWNTNCLALLLEADSNYRRRHERTGESNEQLDGAPMSFLSDEDRKLFSALVDYKLLEMNLATTLTARVGWRPDKTRSAIGPLATCNTCGFPRSVTIMAPGGQCGVCAGLADASDANLDLSTNVSTSDSAWVECAMVYCRAQYVVYFTDHLNVRPKCHYCRFPEGQAGMYFTESSLTGNTTAPVVECTTCLSRIIWPEEYRPTDFQAESYQCPACEAGKKTIVEVDVTARQLMKESSSDTSWLLQNDNNTIMEPFSGRTLFHVISTATATSNGTSDTHVFGDNVAILPDPDPILTLGGKRIRNASEVVAQLQQWISSRRAQSHTCSLCFSNFKPAQLRPACGRRGCIQRICEDCQTSWYGLNARGRIINIAALHCPFCRRLPRPGVIEGLRRRTGNDAAQAQGRHGRQSIVFVGNLAAAIEEQGSWIYAWCASCGNAKQFGERACARGAPPQLTNWTCPACAEARRHGGATGADGTYEASVVIKSCPGCGIPTERIDGCGHVQCEVDGCGVHWCFFCGKEQEEHEIYEHMDDVHGGIYGEGDEDEGGHWEPDEYN